MYTLDRGAGQKRVDIVSLSSAHPTVFNTQMWYAVVTMGIVMPLCVNEGERPAFGRFENSVCDIRQQPHRLLPELISWDGWMDGLLGGDSGQLSGVSPDAFVLTHDPLPRILDIIFAHSHNTFLCTHIHIKVGQAHAFAYTYT